MSDPDRHPDQPAIEPEGLEDGAAGADEAARTPAAAGEVPAAAAADPAAELEAARAEIEALKDSWLRAAAELDNTRRRAGRELEEQTARARAAVLLDLVSVLDDVDRALAALPAGGSEEDEDPITSGVRLIRARLAEVLKRHGVTEMDAEGQPFDPHLHDAVLEVPAGSVPGGAVAEVLVRGYWIGDRVLRPARVAVARHA